MRGSLYGWYDGMIIWIMFQKQIGYVDTLHRYRGVVVILCHQHLAFKKRFFLLESDQIIIRWNTMKNYIIHWYDFGAIIILVNFSFSFFRNNKVMLN